MVSKKHVDDFLITMTKIIPITDEWSFIELSTLVGFGWNTIYFAAVEKVCIFSYKENQTKLLAKFKH